MTRWDWLTWIGVAVLGPGALVIFVFFLRDLRAIWRTLSDNRDTEKTQPPEGTDGRLP